MIVRSCEWKKFRDTQTGKVQREEDEEAIWLGDSFEQGEQKLAAETGCQKLYSKSVAILFNCDPIISLKLTTTTIMVNVEKCQHLIRSDKIQDKICYRKFHTKNFFEQSLFKRPENRSG